MQGLPTKQELEKLYYENGLSIRHISKELKKGHTLIWELFKEYDIPVKPRNTYKNVDEQISKLLDGFNNKDSKKLVNEWVNEQLASNKTEQHKAYIRQKLYTYKIILDPLKKPIKEIIRKDDSKYINEYLKNNINKRKHRIELKAFFKWVNNGDHPKATKGIKTKRTLEEISPEIELLTDKERKDIIANAPTQRDRVIFSIMNENPTRPKDIENLKVKDIKPNEYGYLISFHSKTKAGFRNIQFINSAPDIRIYLSTHEFKKDPEAPLFYSLGNRDKSNPQGIKIYGMSYALQESCRRAGIKRHITLYHFRKTRATEMLSEGYELKEVQVAGGWGNASTLLNVYAKTKDTHFNKRKLEKSGLVEEQSKELKDKFKPKICPRCNTSNSYSVDSCVACWLPLSVKAIEKNKEESETYKKDMDKIMERMAFLEGLVTAKHEGKAKVV